MAESKAKGLTCPHCKGVETHKAHNTAMKRGDEMLDRIKECKACGKHFRTYEIVIGPAEVKTRKKEGPAPQPGVTATAPVVP